MLLLEAAAGAGGPSLRLAGSAAGPADITQHHDPAGGVTHCLHQSGCANICDWNCSGN